MASGSIYTLHQRGLNVDPGPANNARNGAQRSRHVVESFLQSLGITRATAVQYSRASALQGSA